ncbi:heme biosynthesis protein HemY [Pontivivens nitratireducens]|uniref:heme biosynthesis protein HemY n=1 Tax=Pontivivens nitratireducens TaxID=2758038 RepID=UPI001639A385|nr:heme biosynthesis HemY N-terminal domain-containing protein [Pontibrevibacter nitratireducens]
MLWSLLKIILFVALITAAAFGVIYVMDQDGGLTLAVGGREYPFEPIEVLVVLAIAMILFLIVLKLVGLLIAVLRFLTGDETALSRFFDRNRERRGFNALAEAMMLNASGDGKNALSRARKADKLLDRPELTRLVTAQAAEEAGERHLAEEQYKAMLSDGRTRFVGIHGLMRQRLAKGETETALKLAERAFAIRPRHEGLLSTLFTLQTEQAEWDGARRTLAAQVKASALPRDVANRRDAMLTLASARERIAVDDAGPAGDAALEAHRLTPGHVPASVTASRVHLHRNSPRAAQRTLLKTWKIAPHPDLAAAFAALVPDEDPSARRKRFEPLLQAHPDHPETRMLKAELAIADEDFPAARRAMGDLATTAPTTRALAIMAAVERGEGADDKVVRGWLAKALTASQGPQWVCTNCRATHAEWSATCSNCDAFDTIDWLELSQPSASRTDSAAMLPVITGILGSDAQDEGSPIESEEHSVSGGSTAEETGTVPPETNPMTGDIDGAAMDETDLAAAAARKETEPAKSA